MWSPVKTKVFFDCDCGLSVFLFLFAPVCAKYRSGTLKEPRHFLSATLSGQSRRRESSYATKGR